MTISRTDLNFPVPIVSAIIERQRNGEVEVLVQTRWKPGVDPKYSGTLEIPAGAIGPYENVYDALKREVFEETGLSVIGFRPDVRTRLHAQRGDAAFAFVPFCCQQETQGKPRIGFVFVCVVEEAAPEPAQAEVRDIRWIKRSQLRRILKERWIKRSQLRRILKETPERIFTFQLGALDFYLNSGTS